MSPALLVVAREPRTVELARDELGANWRIQAATDWSAAVEEMRDSRPRVVLATVDLLPNRREPIRWPIRPAPKLILLTEPGIAVPDAVGAFFRLTFPISGGSLTSIVDRAAETWALEAEIRRLRRAAGGAESEPRLVARSESMRRVVKTVEMLGLTRTTVLIEGEAGTGKEAVARAIHAAGPDPEAPFVSVRCGALPPDLIQAELLGYERGAFAGADEATAGCLERAGTGTVVLHEIESATPPLQAALVRVLQDRVIHRIGSREPRPFAARLVATSEHPLRRAVATGAFREDLYYRLNVVSIQLPPLRERREDIPVLVDRFLHHYNELAGKEIEFTEEMVAHLVELPWPGNVRELEQFVERAVIMSRNNLVSIASVLHEPDPLPPETIPIRVGMSIRDAEKALVLETLEYTQWNRTRAAQMLGISIRTLRNKLHEYRAEETGEDLDRIPPPGVVRRRT